VRVPLPNIVDESLVWRRIQVPVRDVVFVRGVLEASEGVACMFAEHGGDLMLVAPVSQEKMLDEIVEDLRGEVGAIVTRVSAHGGRKAHGS
jgi:hypothetical protein